MLETNRTIVRVWTSQENKLIPGHNVGHVSIEIPAAPPMIVQKSYVSFWPVPRTPLQKAEDLQANALKKEYLTYFRIRDASFYQTFEADVKGEQNHPPQATICLYSLDASRMRLEFDMLSLGVPPGWRLVGRNLFLKALEEKIKSPSRQKPKAHNCASLALKILEAGGIDNLINLSESSSFKTNASSSVTPDAILEKLLIPSKQAELAKHPKTVGFNYEGEYKIAPPSLTANSCAIL